MSNPLIDLLQAGQSFWLDNIRREWLDEGVLDSGILARVKRGDINIVAGSQVVNPRKIDLRWRYYSYN